MSNLCLNMRALRCGFASGDKARCMFLQLRIKERRSEGGPTSFTVAVKKAIFSNTS